MDADILNAEDACEVIRGHLAHIRHVMATDEGLASRVTTFKITAEVAWGVSAHPDHPARQPLSREVTDLWRHGPVASLTVGTESPPGRAHQVRLDFYAHSRRLGYEIVAVFKGPPNHAFCLACGSRHAKEENVILASRDELIGALAYRITNPDEFPS